MHVGTGWSSDMTAAASVGTELEKPDVQKGQDCTLAPSKFVGGVYHPTSKRLPNFLMH